MALDALTCNHLAPLGFKGLIRLKLIANADDKQPSIVITGNKRSAGPAVLHLSNIV